MGDANRSAAHSTGLGRSFNGLRMNGARDARRLLPIRPVQGGPSTRSGRTGGGCQTFACPSDMFRAILRQAPDERRAGCQTFAALRPVQDDPSTGSGRTGCGLRRNGGQQARVEGVGGFPVRGELVEPRETHALPIQWISSPSLSRRTIRSS